jgi:hypothetical protein
MNNTRKEQDEWYCIKNGHFVYANERDHWRVRFQCIENEFIIELALLCNQ